MKFDLYKLMFGIFYYSSLFVMVWFIIKHNWKDVETMVMVTRLGTIGGLFYLSEIFRKEMTSSKHNANLGGENNG